MINQASRVRSSAFAKATADKQGSGPERSARSVGSVRSVCALLGVVFFAQIASATFDQQRAAMSRSLATQPEAKMAELLKAGLAEGKASLAIADAQKWLRQNVPADSMTLYYAARAAELSGDLKGAVSLYQQYLTKADLKSATADEAVFAVYALLLDRLKDTAGAYAFSRNEGDRLLVCPRAKQFDKWFLDQATAHPRYDVLAVANRLTAAIEAGYPEELLVARYDNYFRWLLQRISGSSGFRRDQQVTQETFDAYKSLVSVMTFDEELKLQLDWAISIRAYVQSAIAGDKNKVFGAGGKKKDKKNKKRGAALPVEETVDAADVETAAYTPIPEAQALLAKYPRHCEWVLIGWAGGTKDNHPNHVGETKDYWPHQVEEKMAPVVGALSKLPQQERDAAFSSMTQGWREPHRLNLHDIKAFTDYVNANPKIRNSRTGTLLLPKSWDRYSPEEAAKIAPTVAGSHDYAASLIRAIAAAGKEKDWNKAVNALLGPEVWRAPERFDMHYMGGYQFEQALGAKGNKEKENAFRTRVAAVHNQIKKGDTNKEAPAAQRVAAFRKLWADYRSPSPKIPAVYPRLKKVLMFTPEMVPELLKDPSPEAQSLVRWALASGASRPEPKWIEMEGTVKVNVNSYAPGSTYLIQRHRGVERMKRDMPLKCKPHPLEGDLRKHLAATVQQNKLEPWQVMAWINMQWPEDNAAQVELMKRMFRSPAWKTLPFEVQFSAREWFGKDAMTPAQVAWMDAGNAGLVCKQLRTLPQDADVNTTVTALTAAMDGVRKSPVRIGMQGLDKLAAVTNTVFFDPKVFDKVLEVVDNMHESVSADALGERLLAKAKKDRDPVLIQRAGFALWNRAHTDPRSSFRDVPPFVDSLLEDSPAAAHSMARLGIHLFTGRNAYGFDWRKSVAPLKAIAGKAAMKLGLVAIQVSKNHPAYPIYKSQADWLTANEDSAWALLNGSNDEGVSHWEQLMPIHRELSIEYLMWVLQRTIYNRDDSRMEHLIKGLLDWSGESGSPWSKEQKIDLEIAYGDVALQLGQVDNAHKIFAKTQQNPAYADLLARHRATLRRVKVERIAKRFDDALKTLSELDMERIPELWAASRYARAEVYYDSEEYDDAADDIAAILAREPDHGEAKIMQGKVQLKRQKLMEASELDVGSKDAKNTLVPGEDLKVTLVDPTLAVSGAGTEIEVTVWADSGDKESFFLRQFGDQKTKFRGEVKTSLGAPNPDDRVLQVIGDDKIYYAYSERFRKKMNDLEEKRGGPITVRSDAILMASARKLLSEAEQRVADMEAKMAALARGKQKVGRAEEIKAKVAAAQEAVKETRTREDREAAEAEEKARLAEQLLRTRVKPGKSINVRVIDPDRSRTPGIDTLTVSIESSSGDSIGQITLKETDTHSGWFEGTIPTAGAQAMAFAANSEPGRNPNMVISPKTGYQAWKPVPVANRKPEFKIDLNDNVALGEMTITAKEPGATLKKFILETGMNPKSMNPIAVFPTDTLTLAKPWHPSVTVMKDTDHHQVRDERSVYDLNEIAPHMERGWMTQQYPEGHAQNVSGPSAAFTNAVHAKGKWLRHNRHHNAHVIYRFRAYFYESGDVTRRFKVDLGKWEPANVHSSVAHPAQYMLAIDGRRVSEVLEKPPKAGAPVSLEGQLNLRRGIHHIEIWATGWDCRIGFGRDVKVYSNVDRADVMTPCSDRFFDPATFPKGVLPHRNGKATITAGAGGTEFNVKFGRGSQARLVNLVIISQEGPVPALNRITLSKPDGKRVLPVAQDYAELNKNNILEILTGDKVAVRYVDDRFVTKAKEKHERFLEVSFSDARAEFVFFEMRKKFDGQVFVNEPYYEQLLRFRQGKPLTLRINDADMDMTDEPDSVEVTVSTGSGFRKKFTARETGPSTAEFRLVLMPVTGSPAKENEIKIVSGDTVSLTYRDVENISPGVPVNRYASVRHAVYSQPQMRISHATVKPIDYSKYNPNAEDRRLHPPGARRLEIGFATREERAAEAAAAALEAGEGLLAANAPRRRQDVGGGTIRPRWSISNQWANVMSPPTGGIRAVHGQEMAIEFEAPHLALRSGSRVAVYLQSDASREQGSLLGGSLDGAAGPAFDINLPGTIKLSAGLAGPTAMGGFAMWSQVPLVPIYLGAGGYGVPNLAISKRIPGGKGGHWERSDIIFSCRIPLVAGFLPEEGVLPPEEIERRQEKNRGKGAKIPIPGNHSLVARPGQKVHVGIPYKDKAGVERWLTGSATVTTHPVLDVMEDDYRTEKKTAYVGESLFIRVVDLGADVSDEADTVSVLLQAKSGAKHRVELLEVDNHSGVFRANYELSYVKKKPASSNDLPYSVRQDGFPVVYGDVMGAGYSDAKKQKADTKLLKIYKGADGRVYPFSKKYDNPEIAMRTQFSMAEAYLEMAKRHRKLGEEALATDEYARAKDMLEKAMDMFREPDTRAQAEYLLGNLTQEEAGTTEDKELREDRFRAALSRYMRVTGSYPDTLPASKAQFKIARVYEELNEPEIAAQEFVKLAYKYPDSEFLALAMARLGTHFQKKAASYEAKAKDLIAKGEAGDKDAEYDGKAMEIMYKKEYVKAAEIFGRLQVRFPDHELAGKGGLRAGQAYMRAGEDRDGLNAFKRVFEHEAYDGPKIRAQAMYWAGMCYENLGEAMAAYSIYKRLTFDFPESQWASFARGQLSSDKLLTLEENLELKRVEDGR